VSAWGAEKRHRSVPHVLVDHSAVSIDDRIDNGEETLEQGADLLGVQFRRQARIADNVAEHDRDRTTVAFALDGRFRVVLVDGASATPAEAIGGVVRVAAVPTGDRERRPAGCAESAPFPVVGLASCTAHDRGSRSARRGF